MPDRIATVEYVDSPVIHKRGIIKVTKMLYSDNGSDKGKNFDS